MEILRTIDIDGVEYQLGDKVEAIPDSEIDRILSSMEEIDKISDLQNTGGIR